MPHVLEPPRGPRARALELILLGAGAINGGYVGLWPGAEAARFVDWLCARLHERCENRVAEGMHHDQRWLDLAPTLFAGVHLVRDPGANVAWWNVAGRALHLDGDAATGRVRVIGGEPLRFFHFSGYDLAQPERLTRYYGWPELDRLPAVPELVDRYAGLLRAARHAELLARPYAFDRFDDGVAVPAELRRAWHRLPELQRPWAAPFAAGGDLRAWLEAPAPMADDAGGAAFANAWRCVHAARPDLAQAYPQPLAGDAAAFAAWIESSGRAEAVLDPCFG
jgi:hypothetical protein